MKKTNGARRVNNPRLWKKDSVAKYGGVVWRVGAAGETGIAHRDALALKSAQRSATRRRKKPLYAPPYSVISGMVKINGISV